MGFVRFIIFIVFYWIIAIPLAKVVHNAIGGLLGALFVEVLGYYLIKYLVRLIFNNLRIKGGR